MTTWSQYDFSNAVHKQFERETEQKNELLLEVIKTGDKQLFFETMEKGYPDSSCCINNQTPLSLALDKNQKEIFEWLIKLFHADVNHEFNNGYSLIWRTLWENKMDYFNILIREVSKNKTKEKTKGKTILMEAVRLSKLDAVKSIVVAGFNVNERDNEGNTALHYALSKKPMTQIDKEIVEYLIAANADVLAKNIHDNTPLDVAEGFAKTPEGMEIQPENQTPKPQNKKTYGNKKSYAKKYNK